MLVVTPYFKCQEISLVICGKLRFGCLRSLIRFWVRTIGIIIYIIKWIYYLYYSRSLWWLPIVFSTLLYYMFYICWMWNMHTAKHLKMCERDIVCVCKWSGYWVFADKTDWPSTRFYRLSQSVVSDIATSYNVEKGREMKLLTDFY